MHIAYPAWAPINDVTTTYNYKRPRSTRMSRSDRWIMFSKGTLIAYALMLWLLNFNLFSQVSVAAG